MTKSNSSGSAKNPAGSNSELSIPTLGNTPSNAAIGAAPAASLLQEGETEDVLSVNAATRENADHQHQRANEGLQRSLADVQREADANKGRGQQAMHRPATMRQDREQTSDTPTVTVEMPISGPLDAMRRNDQFIEPVVDIANFGSKAETLAFMEEMVEIRIHESNDPNAENPVVLGVNGRQVAIWRGEDTIVRRKYVEQLLRAKPESLLTQIKRDGDGNPRNLIHKSRALKYPFSIVRDDNRKGPAWERKIRAES